MTSEEKARELAIKSTKYIDDNGKDMYNVLVEAALQEMAEWKEKQMIDKAVDWLQLHANDFMPASYSFQKYETNGLLYYFKKAMKGGEE